MSFSIVLQRNSSDTNVISKSITDITTVSGTLKEATSILNPVIKIEGSIPTTCNYMYISEFGRYYYIVDIRSINNDLFEVTGRVDVLKTYETAIKNCEGIVARQETKGNWNLFLDDGSFKTYQQQMITIKKFPHGFNTQSFVLALAGD